MSSTSMVGNRLNDNLGSRALLLTLAISQRCPGQFDRRLIALSPYHLLRKLRFVRLRVCESASVRVCALKSSDSTDNCRQFGLALERAT